MTGKNRIRKYAKFGLQLTQVERKLILVGDTKLPNEIIQAIHGTAAKQPITMTLDDWRELAGHIASEANETTDKSLQKKLDTVFSKIQDLLDSHPVEGLFNSQKAKQSHSQRSRSNSPNGLLSCLSVPSNLGSSPSQ